MPILSLFTLPFRAPLLGGLFLVALVMGNHWTVNQSIYAQNQSISVSVFWLIQLIQVIAVVVVFTIPDLLMRQVSMLMASSRVISLVVTLLMVIVLLTEERPEPEMETRLALLVLDLPLWNS